MNFFLQVCEVPGVLSKRAAGEIILILPFLLFQTFLSQNFVLNLGSRTSQGLKNVFDESIKIVLNPAGSEVKTRPCSLV